MCSTRSQILHMNCIFYPGEHMYIDIEFNQSGLAGEFNTCAAEMR